MKIKELFSGETDNTFIQFFRYLFVGGFAFVVDYGTLMLLVEVFGFNAKLAAVVAFILGLIVNYILSTLWIFKNSKIGNRLAEFAAFAVIGVIGLGINELIIWLFDDVIAPRKPLDFIPEDKYYLIGKLVSTAVVFIWNFAARKFIIFNKNSTSEEEPK
ncbi:Putative flippase GtrA (transmembrane translocase of bactoprenol-linked glucose) [Ruminococcaceae bacterium FB2012]|nr:Putative flippase GtrA (transmembrane translocase of bactoprenol-linked glucose) [Ruminococcaceae bacterium FB2012]